MDNAELALKLIGKLRNNYSNELCQRYKLTDIEGKTDLEIMEEIGNKRGCKVSGGDIDYTKTANIIMDEFRKNVIVKISLERPN